MKTKLMYVTKYAITEGIIEFYVDVDVLDSPKSYASLAVRGCVTTFLIKDKTIFDTREEAEKEVRKVGRKRIASMEKSIEKIKKLCLLN